MAVESADITSKTVLNFHCHSIKMNMFLNDKYYYGACLSLAVASAYAWKKVLDNTDCQKYEIQIDHHNKHNCVVMYCPERGMFGWPPNEKSRKIVSIKGLGDLYEPILYFINSAEKTLDVSVMILTVHPIILALQAAAVRGVKVRIVLDGAHCSADERKNSLIVQLQVSGAPIIFFNNLVDHMMHHKYMLKDYNQKSGGYALMCSLNFTVSAFTGNYENIILTSQKTVSDALHENFEEIWEYIKNQNKVT